MVETPKPSPNRTVQPMAPALLCPSAGNAAAAAAWTAKTVAVTLAVA